MDFYYLPARTLCTSIITSFGFFDKMVQDKSIIPKFILTYAIADTAALHTMRKLEMDILLHHIIISTSALLCFESVSGPDHVPCNNIITKLCACETMGLLSSVNNITKRRFQRFIDLLHIINIIVLRRKVWVECDKEYCEDIKSNKIRFFTKSLARFMLFMDLYWSIMIIRKYIFTR